jgi:death-on-curing protein
MDAPFFLTVGEVLELHQRSLDEFGGSSGICDMALLESALGMPSASFCGQFLHGSLADMAGAYLFHLVQNHPFIDGNKRTGAVAARTFLLMNGGKFDPSEAEYADLVLAVASGKADKAACIEFFKKHVR